VYVAPEFVFLIGDKDSDIVISLTDVKFYFSISCVSLAKLKSSRSMSNIFVDTEMSSSCLTNSSF
jgi:hypothetical protein